MTNREYMIKALQNPSRDKDYEDMIYSHICCAYGFDDERGECRQKALVDVNIRNMCVRCKEKWLDSEVEE